MRWSAFAAAAVMLAVGCTTKNTQNQFLAEVGSLSKEEIMARGDAIAAKKKWEEARKYYSFLADSFPNDPLGRQAALKVADTFYDEGGTESLTEAQLRYKDFSNRFPNDPSRAYALLMLGKVSYAQQKGPMRDLTPVRTAVDNLRQAVKLYPDSRYAKETRELLDRCVEELAEHEYLVASFYANSGAWLGAKQRLDYLFATYPDTAVAKHAVALRNKVDAHFQGMAPPPPKQPERTSLSKPR
jgi:outer membrane protein assembly factor BamD